MTARPINPTLKAVLEFGPALVFFALYMWLKGKTFAVGGTEYSGFIVATAVFVPVVLLAMVALWKLSGRVSRMQVVTAVMVVFFGGLTVWFNNEMFFKMKTTIVYGLFAVILYAGLVMGRSWLEYVMGELLPMQREGWMILTRRLAMAFSFLAVANEIVWRTMSEQTWVTVETFGFPVALFLFLWSQIVMLQPYLIEDEKTKVE
ncbi:MAG: septation protein IspZ [Rhodobacteraceae bacterium]|jgi:intracellular septation protein|nr:septation protein IspZ [Paracoccaceae bacterium]